VTSIIDTLAQMTEPTTTPDAKPEPTRVKLTSKPTSKTPTVAELLARLKDAESKLAQAESAKNGKPSLGLHLDSLRIKSDAAKCADNGKMGTIQALIESANDLLTRDANKTPHITYAAITIATLVDSYYQTNHLTLSKESDKQAKVFAATAKFVATCKRLKLVK